MFLNFEDFKSMYPDYTLDESAYKSLEERAEVDINGLTFSRSNNFDTLTDYQKVLVKRATAMQVMFINDNSELIDSPLSSYSISGVSMSFDKSKVVQLDNVTTTRAVYGVLEQTGLCYRGL